MIDTRIVLSVIAARTASGSTRPSLSDRQVGDLEALALEALAGVEHRLVLGLRGDDVVALLLVELGGALDREVVRLGRARGPDDLLARRRRSAPRPARAPGRPPSRRSSRTRGCGSPRCRSPRVKYGSIASSTRGSTGGRRVVVHVDRELQSHRRVSFGSCFLAGSFRDPIDQQRRLAAVAVDVTGAALGLGVRRLARAAAVHVGQGVLSSTTSRLSRSMVACVSRSLSAKISRTRDIALGAVSLSSQSRRKALISVRLKPMSCSF